MKPASCVSFCKNVNSPQIRKTHKLIKTKRGLDLSILSGSYGPAGGVHECSDEIILNKVINNKIMRPVIYPKQTIKDSDKSGNVSLIRM